MEIAKAFFVAWNAGDMDAVREAYDRHIVVRYAPGWPEGSQPIMGREAVVRQWEQQREAFDADTLEPIDFIDAGDRVVARQVWHAVGHGPDLSLEFSSVSTLRNGKTILVEFFWDHAEALETLGLSEQPVSQGNAEIVQGMYQAWNRSGGVPQLELMDPEIEVDTPGPGGGIYRGHAGLSKVLESFWGLFRGAPHRSRGVPSRG